MESGDAGRPNVVIIFGVLAMAASGAVGGLVAYDNRRTTVHLDIAGYVWSGRLYAVLVAGALLACWFLLGVSCIRLRLRERRAPRTASSRTPGPTLARSPQFH